MGQRFQSIFILPSVFMNKDNPNNRSEKVLVYHNQWLYGMGAININLLIIERLKKAINKARKRKQDYYISSNINETIKNHHLERFLENAINWASVQELNNETNFSLSDTLIYSEEEKKQEEERTSLKEIIKQQDNNNGYFIAIIWEDLKISYAFLNGFEDSPIIEKQSPKSYLKLFYSDEDLKKLNVYNFMQKQFIKFNKFKEIDINLLEDIIKYLNENKPNWA